jgi:activating signal cointegrator complex subunit 1
MAKHRNHRPGLPSSRRPNLTHFLCLPLITPESTPQFQQSVAAFRRAVTVSNEDGETAPQDATVASRIHPEAIRPVGSLHLTLGVMALDGNGLEAAVNVLEGVNVAAMLEDAQAAASAGTTSINAQIERPASSTQPLSPEEPDAPVPLTLDFKGLTSMHDPTQTSILYLAPHDPSNRLYHFCLALQQHFQTAGLLVQDDRALRLHATVVNTVYAKSRNTKPARREVGDGDSSSRPGEAGLEGRTIRHGPHANASLKIDATEVLEHFKDFVWAERVTLDRIAICEMGAKKVVDEAGSVVNEAYTEVATAPLPT